MYSELSKPMTQWSTYRCSPYSARDGPVPGISEKVAVYSLSHKLSATQQRWSVTEEVAYTIMYTLQKLDYYLNGAMFIIKTDQKPLQYLLEGEWTNKKIQQ